MAKEEKKRCDNKEAQVILSTCVTSISTHLGTAFQQALSFYRTHNAGLSDRLAVTEAEVLIFRISKSSSSSCPFRRNWLTRILERLDWKRMIYWYFISLLSEGVLLICLSPGFSKPKERKKWCKRGCYRPGGEIMIWLFYFPLLQNLIDFTLLANFWPG